MQYNCRLWPTQCPRACGVCSQLYHHEMFLNGAAGLDPMATSLNCLHREEHV